MRHTTLATAILSIVIGLTNLDQPAVAEDQPEFVALFNGKDLAGWEGDTKLWKVADGMIVGDSPGIKQNQFLTTKQEYGNFELRLEFRLHGGKGNSGVQFRSKRVPDSTAVTGYQADIGQQYWGALYDEHRRNKMLAKPSPTQQEKLFNKESWNSYFIRAEGRRVTLKVNGETTVDYVEADDAIARTGIIALQLHSGPAMRVDFRNIRIRSLDKQ